MQGWMSTSGVHMHTQIHINKKHIFYRQILHNTLWQTVFYYSIFFVLICQAHFVGTKAAGLCCVVNVNSSMERLNIHSQPAAFPHNPTSFCTSNICFKIVAKWVPHYINASIHWYIWNIHLSFMHKELGLLVCSAKFSFEFISVYAIITDK